MAHPENSKQINLIRQYISDVGAVVNGLEIIPRDKFTYAFDSIALEVLSKSFALAEACLILLDAGSPDEAYGLSRSLVECAINLRYLTQDLAKLDERTDAFKNHELAEKRYWLHYALEQSVGKPEEQDIKDYAKQLGITPDTKAATLPWSGVRGFVWQVMAGDHPLDGPAPKAKVPAYAVDYHQTSSYVHCSQPALDNYFPKEGAPFSISPSSGDYDQPSQKVLFIAVVYLHSSICYALYGLGVDRPAGIGTLFQEVLSKMDTVKRLHS